jgi:hypothetical protein
MKTLLILILSAVSAFGGEAPTVEVYSIHKHDAKASVPALPEVILEIANPTEKTFYISGTSIEAPMFHVEALREKRWLRIPYFLCGTGSSMRPLKPGAKMLVTVSFPWEETAARFRFFFFTSANDEKAKVVTVRSRGIEKKELGDLSGTTGELTSDAKLEEPISDDEMNKDRTKSEEPKDPFAQ